ncbi:metalloprotease PmbA [Anaplasma platys]|uniref:Metalloprotease PmbA n=1 Tax=Anaplasma platys TaxID=949 RepID=A0A858PYF0_9RICK|nr:TldD/PmbA family protein [Anaplasma platys]QJC27597.1 metalloprotease PmbA [Anaplasma platys]
MDILNAAEDVIKLIKGKGVEGEVVVSKQDSISVSQRLLKPEEMVQDRGVQIGVRVVVGDKKHACISSNDIEGIADLIDTAVSIADLSPEDPYFSLSEEAGSYADSGEELMMCDDTVVDVGKMREILTTIEEEALATDSRVVNTEEVNFAKATTEVALVSTKGFYGSYKRSCFSAYISTVASENNKMEVDYSFSVKSKFSDLEDPKTLGREAANRTLKRLNARDIKTCRMPIVFENRVASSLLSNFAAAINGEAVANKTSFLSAKMGEKIFRDDICIVDDPLVIGGISSRPFDGEGIMSKRKNVVENGILKSWILDMRTAKRLSLNTTGNASRSSNASVSPKVSNFFIEPSGISVSELISDIKYGLYITDLFGFGINLTTGDYSQGAFGFIIDNGSISYPVHGVTVAGNLASMFSSMRAANDLVLLKSVNSPTLRFSEMVVSGTD